MPGGTTLRAPLRVILIATLLLVPVAGNAAPDGLADDHSKNIVELAQVPIRMPSGERAAGSDLAFEKDLIVAGSYSGTAFYRILKDAPYVKQVGFHNCPGGQGDVSVYKDLAFVSLDSPQAEGTVGCLEKSAEQSAGKEGVRILDIDNPRKPRQIDFVETDCGSHTHVINPTKKSIFIYVQSYPLSVPTETCSAVSHRKVSIIEVPLKAPTKAKVVSTLDVSPEIGCHDVTIFPSKKYAAAACIGESQIWDITDPAAPIIVSRIVNPSIQIHHGTGVTWDENVLAIADEFAGSITGECAGSSASPIGALWFYDISDPTLPILLGYYNVPRRSAPDTADEASYVKCTSHNFNILPTKDRERYIASVGYRSAGLSVVDFSNPAAPREVAHYHQLPEGAIPDVWSAYWYNGRIYANDNAARRGISVYRMNKTSSKQVRYFRDRLNPQVQVADFR
jgi:hypothetical protein